VAEQKLAAHGDTAFSLVDVFGKNASRAALPHADTGSNHLMP
jgi:hypothetical protein